MYRLLLVAVFLFAATKVFTQTVGLYRKLYRKTMVKIMRKVPRKDRLENTVINKIMREQRKTRQNDLRKEAADYWVNSRS